jgi:hypothetical protein
MKRKTAEVLLIAYWFPPASNQTWRSYRMFSALQNYFREIRIISTSNRNFLPIKDFNDTAKHVSTALTLDHRLFTYFNRKEIKHVDEKFKPKWAFKIYNLFNSFPFNLLIGEGGFLYIISGYKKGLGLINKKYPTLVFSSYRPYSDHAIAYLIKCSRPHTTWVADFRDLHVDPALKETYFPKIQSWFNKKILAKADVVTTVSKGLAEHLKAIHPNVVVLRNGIGELPITPAANSQLPTVKHFTITYTGSMFRDLRKPDLLLEALSELIAAQKIAAEQVQIRYAGKDTATWIPLLEKYGLVPSIFLGLGNVTHQEAVQLQCSTHINLLLTYATPELKGNATGKLYEYLAAKQPVLLLVNGCKDEELEEIFEATNAGMIAYDSMNHKDLVKAFLLETYQEWQMTGLVAPAIADADLDAFRWENMMAAFLEKHVFITGFAQKPVTDFEIKTNNP